MNDVEKIIKALEHHKDTWVCTGCPYEDAPDAVDGKCPIYDDVIALLREQEPVEPKNGKCPECGYTLHRINYDGLYNGIRHEWFRFCPSCGRVVKWDE